MKLENNIGNNNNKLKDSGGERVKPISGEVIEVCYFNYFFCFNYFFFIRIILIWM
jgi:hypothetical protein